MESRLAQTHPTGHPRRWAVIALSVILLLSPGQTRQEQPQTSGALGHIESAAEVSTKPVAANADSARFAELTARFPDGIIPLWALRQDAPIVGNAGNPDPVAASITASDCPPSLQFPVPRDVIAPHFDSARGIWEVYCSDATGNQIMRYDIDPDLNVSDTAVAPYLGLVWVAEDLNRDGVLDFVTQAGDKLRVYSGDDWELQVEYIWPGYNVVMHAVAALIDSDDDYEVYLTPSTIGGSSRAVILDYNLDQDSFLIVADIPLPPISGGQSAIADFDNDGRTEIITGNVNAYGLLEWQETTLVYIGQIGEPYDGLSAAVCKPNPGGTLHVLLGHSSGGANGFLYQLMAPIGENQFETVHTFQELTDAGGIHPCFAVDTDCDGIDELAMGFWPIDKSYEFNPATGAYELVCEWDFAAFGTLKQWHAIDVNQDGAAEWLVVNHDEIVFDFPGSDCLLCDSIGVCYASSINCYCHCPADPDCDGLTDVFDVIAAVDVAFRSAPPNPDPYPQCPRERTDTNCDGLTNVFDVVAFVDVAFRAGNPETVFCVPCP